VPLAASVADSQELEQLVAGRDRVAVCFQRRGSHMHHFDLANWLVSDRPVAVSATLVEGYARTGAALVLDHPVTQR
jgi:predicted dehydrogenase